MCIRDRRLPARSGTPSREPLSANTVSVSLSVAAASEVRNLSRYAPGEYVTVTTASGNACSRDVDSFSGLTVCRD